MSGLNLSHLKKEVVRPTLKKIGLWSEAAENLVTGTALAESGGKYLRQLGAGPALGLWQMEPLTHDDCWQNFLNFPVNKTLASTISALRGNDEPAVEHLISNLRYACAMARIKYLRSPAALPPANDAKALSAYHKSWYNSSKGAANIDTNAPIFLNAIKA